MMPLTTRVLPFLLCASPSVKLSFATGAPIATQVGVGDFAFDLNPDDLLSAVEKEDEGLTAGILGVLRQVRASYGSSKTSAAMHPAPDQLPASSHDKVSMRVEQKPSIIRKSRKPKGDESTIQKKATSGASEGEGNEVDKIPEVNVLGSLVRRGRTAPVIVPAQHVVRLRRDTPHDQASVAPTHTKRQIVVTSKRKRDKDAALVKEVFELDSFGSPDVELADESEVAAISSDVQSPSLSIVDAVGAQCTGSNDQLRTYESTLPAQ